LNDRESGKERPEGAVVAKPGVGVKKLWYTGHKKKEGKKGREILS